MSKFLEETTETIQNFKDSIQTLSTSSKFFADQYKSYTSENLRDASFLKEKIIERIMETTYEDE